MSRVLAALLVGAAIGAAVFFFLRDDAPTVSAPSALATAPHATGAAGPVAGSRAYVSPTHPGVVVNVTRNGGPEAQARVELSRSLRSIVTTELVWEPAGAETTDAEGRAEFPALSGRYYATATATDGTRAVEVLDVRWGAAPTYLTIALKPGVTFSGQVVDAATRKPLGQALVRADPQPDPNDLEPTISSGSTSTDSLGRFALELPSQRWRLEARAPGYLAEPIAVEAPSKELIIELTRGVELTGQVVDAAGEAIADATVRLTPGDVTSLTTNREGRFSLTAPRSPISIHALAPDGRQGLSRVTFNDKQETAAVRIVVANGSELVGVVRDAQGPVAHAEVRILAEPESLEVASFDTALDGRFAAKGLPPGRYSVRAQQGTGRRASAISLELPGAAPVELVLSESGRVVGVVNDGEGRPVEGAEVNLTWPKGLKEVRRSARTGSDGRFDFADLLPAEVFVQAQFSDLLSEEVSAYVAPGTTAELALTAAQQGRLAGTVTGAPIERLLVRSDKPGGEFITIDKAQRSFEKVLAPGTYHLFAEVKGDEDDQDFRFIESQLAVVRAGELTTVVVDVPGNVKGASAVPFHKNFDMHPELGSGLSFENSPGGVRVDFLMSDCPAAKAGVKLGDLVVAIDGETTRDAQDAFARVRKPSDGATLDVMVRREGQDLKLTLR
jgi:hypothetical protein